MVVNSNSPVACRREERVLQLLRMMNLYLAKKRETSRRHLMFSAPSVVAVSPNTRLVEVCACVHVDMCLYVCGYMLL